MNKLVSRALMMLAFLSFQNIQIFARIPDHSNLANGRLRPRRGVQALRGNGERQFLIIRVVLTAQGAVAVRRARADRRRRRETTRRIQERRQRLIQLSQEAERLRTIYNEVAFNHRVNNTIRSPHAQAELGQLHAGAHEAALAAGLPPVDNIHLIGPEEGAQG